MYLHVVQLAQVRSKAGRPCGGGKGYQGIQFPKPWVGASSLAVGTFKPEVAKEAWKEQPSPNGAPLKGSLTCLTHKDLCRVLDAWNILESTLDISKSKYGIVLSYTGTHCIVLYVYCHELLSECWISLKFYSFLTQSWSFECRCAALVDSVQEWNEFFFVDGHIWRSLDRASVVMARGSGTWHSAHSKLDLALQLQCMYFSFQVLQVYSIKESRCIESYFGCRRRIPTRQIISKFSNIYIICHHLTNSTKPCGSNWHMTHLLWERSSEGMQFASPQRLEVWPATRSSLVQGVAHPCYVYFPHLDPCDSMCLTGRYWKQFDLGNWHMLHMLLCFSLECLGGCLRLLASFGIFWLKRMCWSRHFGNPSWMSGAVQYGDWSTESPCPSSPIVKTRGWLRHGVPQTTPHDAKSAL